MALRAIINPATQALIDRALVLTFKSPASFTGEDVVEYHIHGSPAVLRELLAVLGEQPGHRLAQPGEFTRRAFENGKLDLTAAEGLADLINAQTQAQKQQALHQMGGALSKLYEDWAQQLTRALAHLEADIEFPDEDLPEGIAPEIHSTIAEIGAAIAAHLNDNRRGERLREGLQVAIIGAPNAGKSTLINALAQRDVAIVSPMPGTTRDVIDVALDFGGYPFVIADTAGLRPDAIGASGHEDIECEGMKRARARAGAADITILLFDGTTAQPDAHTLDFLDARALVVVNKADQPQKLSLPDSFLLISAQTGQGVDGLMERLIGRARDLLNEGANEAPSLTRARHREALAEACGHIQRFQNATLPELAAEDLRLAVRAIGRITGRVDVEDLLDVIFRDFCIGK